MILWFIVGFNVVLCVFLLLAAFREGRRIRNVDMNRNYIPGTWSILEMFEYIAQGNLNIRIERDIAGDMWFRVDKK